MNNDEYTVTDGPDVEPVTTAQAKTHARVDTSDDDTYIGTLITAARRYCEQYTRRTFVTTTYEWTLRSLPAGELVVPRPPLQSVSSIKYIDTDGNEQTWSSDDYQVSTAGVVGRIKPAYSETWPSYRGYDYDAVTVTFVAGYGDAAADVPQEIVHAIKFLVAHWYEHREPVLVGTSITSIPLTVKNLLLQG